MATHRISDGSHGATAINTDTRAMSYARRFALAVGSVFLLVGILGFVPGITEEVGQMTFAGHHTDSQLLGIFEVSILHNLVHILFGIAGILAARRIDTARSYLLVGGVIYLVLALYGVLIDYESDANFVPVNSADNVLHVVLGLGMIGLAVASRKLDHDEAHDRINPRI